MFETYIVSVIIYMIITYCTLALFGDAIKKMGWIGDNTRKSSIVKKLVVLFCVSAVPVLRVVFIVFSMYMATHTKEEFDEWKAEQEKNK